MKLAIFDFDGTLFPKDTLPFLFTQWYRHKYSTLKLAKVFLPLIPLYIRYKTGINGNLTKEKIRVMGMQGFNRIFTGMTAAEVSEYFLKTSQVIKGLLNPSVVDEVHKAKKQGFHTVILSGAYSTLLEPIGTFLDVDTIIGSTLYFSNSLFDFNQEPDLISGSVKVQKLLQYFHGHDINWQESWAYADSYSDLPLLELIGNPIVVNPDPELRSIACQRNWPLL